MSLDTTTAQRTATDLAEMAALSQLRTLFPHTPQWRLVAAVSRTTDVGDAAAWLIEEGDDEEGSGGTTAAAPAASSNVGTTEGAGSEAVLPLLVVPGLHGSACSHPSSLTG